MTRRITGKATLYMGGRQLGVVRDARIGADVLVEREPAPIVDTRTEGERLTDAAIEKWERERVPF